jgi:hypothetical protein
VRSQVKANILKMTKDNSSIYKRIYWGSHIISWSLLVEISMMVVLCLHCHHIGWVFLTRKLELFFNLSLALLLYLCLLFASHGLCTWFIMSSLLLLSKESCQPCLTCPYHYVFNFQVFILVPLTTVCEFKCVITVKIIYITKCRHKIFNFHCKLTQAIDCLDWLRIKEQTRFITSGLMEWIHCTPTYISTSEPKCRPTWLQKGILDHEAKQNLHTHTLFNRPVGLQKWSHSSLCVVGELEGA